MHKQNTPAPHIRRRFLVILAVTTAASVIATSIVMWWLTQAPQTPPTQFKNQTNFVSGEHEKLVLQPGRKLPNTFYGITTESVENIDRLNYALSLHKTSPFTRVVFQKKTEPAHYSEPLRSLRQNSYVMGQIYDSTAVAESSVSQYRERTRNFVKEFGNSIDIYEIGNELNGEWLGEPDEINQKVMAAYEVVEKENQHANLNSAITLNCWPSSNCYAKPWEETLRYAQALPTELRSGVDYVFLSFYETACNPRAQPSETEFIATFSELKNIFPTAKIGVGEIGAQGKVDGLDKDPTFEEKKRIADRYYGMHKNLKVALGERYVGGYFWWYYYQDVVESENFAMWQVIENNFNKMRE
ncbi:Tat pathway signal sequence [Candidatus Saccharibacteria bacterium]|nr:Tat pathway signal sequence [Candidatus Saccharibacteria bacterium]